VAGRGTLALAQGGVRVSSSVRTGARIFEAGLKGVQAGVHASAMTKGSGRGTRGVVGGGSNKGNTGGTSHTVIQKTINKQNVRIDIEFPTGGSSGNVHIHIGNQKIYLDSFNDIGNLPKAIRKDSDVQRAIKKAFDLLSRY
jgi:hypothetical protein